MTNRIPLDSRQALTITEAGALLGVSRATAYQWVKDGKLRTVTIGNLARATPVSGCPR